MSNPSSEVILLRGVPFTENSLNLVKFASETEQYNYFVSLAKHPPITECSFIRNSASGKAISVGIDSDSLLDINYLMYRNPTTSNKWFYGFVTNVQYISDGTSQIYYSVDLWQTWQFEYNIKSGFIERETVASDVIGEHTIPEDVELGTYVTTAQNRVESGYVIAIFSTVQSRSSLLNAPSNVGGLNIPCYWKVSYTGIGAIQSIIDDLDMFTGNPIVSIFTVPRDWVNTDSNTSVKVVQVNNGNNRTLTITPKNNKLYTYPYTALSVSTAGSNKIFKYELFNGSPNFEINGVFGANPVITLTPTNYENDLSVIHQLSLTGYPLLPWIDNYYAEWQASKNIDILAWGANSISNAVINTPTKNSETTSYVRSNLSNISSYVINTMAQTQQALLVPDSMSGSASALDTNTMSGKNCFYFACRSIRAEYATAIDNFFSVYGYKVNRIGVPNITSRRYWNFVKMGTAIVTGNAPLDALKFLESALLSGCTFWHTVDVGNYNLTNSIR